MSESRKRLHEPARSGFTITELLVVMAIIGLVIGMLVPTASKVRLHAMRGECLNNMRNLTQAHTMYMTDNRGRFVPADPADGGSGDPRISWMTILPQNYLSGFDALRSPVDRSPFWAKKDGGHWDGLTLAEALDELGADPEKKVPKLKISRWSSYGVNDLLAMDQGVYPNPETGEPAAWTRLSQVRNPANTVHFVMMTEGRKEEGGNPTFARTDHVHVLSWSGPTIPGMGEQDPSIVAMEQVQLNAHGGQPKTWTARAGYGFLDGHVATHKFSEVYQSRMQNRFNPAYSYRLALYDD